MRKKRQRQAGMENHAPGISTMKRKTQLASACLAMFTLGFMYGWSVFAEPINAEFMWDPSTLALTFTLTMWLFCIGGFAGAKLCEVTNSHITIIAAAVLIFCAFTFAALFARADAPWTLYLTYSVLSGLGGGMAYTVTMATTLSWFPEKTGTASGMMLLCYGISTLILSSAAAWLFSLMSWRMAFPIIAAVMAALLAVCGGIILRRPTAEEAALLPKPTPKGGEAREQRSYTMHEVLRIPVFWSFFIWMIIVSSVTLGWASNINQFALTAGAQPALAVVLVGVYSIGNGIGRLLFGMAYDALGTFKTILLVTIARGVVCVLVLLGLVFSSVPIMAVALACAGLTTGGTPVCAASFAATAFGPAQYAKNLSCLNTSTIPAALIGPLIMSFSLSWTGGYIPGLVIGIILIGVGVAMTFATKRLLARMA